MRRLLVLAIVSAALVSLTPLSAAAGPGRGGSGWHGGGGSQKGGGWHGGGGWHRSGGWHRGGGWHGGHKHGWHGRGGWHGHGWYGGRGWWGPGFAFGAYPYWPYPYYGYYGGYYGPSVVYSNQPTVYAQPPAVDTPAAPPAVEREVVYPHGRYVLRGDGVTTPYEWVWIPTPGGGAPERQ